MMFYEGKKSMSMHDQLEQEGHTGDLSIILYYVEYFFLIIYPVINSMQRH